MKQFECGTLVPGCPWHTQADDGAEIIRRVAEHLRAAHGEAEIRPEMIDRIKQRIRDAASART